MMLEATQVPGQRIRQLNDQPLHGDGEYVLYWMTASRRLTSNFALQRACELARQQGKPLLVFEALRVDYQWASRRLHAFVIQGMHDNAAIARAAGHRYEAWIERSPGAGAGLIESLASRACGVVTDDFPCFFLPRMTAAVARRVTVRVEAVDSNGLLPMRAADAVFPSAYAFRRYLQRSLSPHLVQLPVERPLADRMVPRMPVNVDVIGEHWQSGLIGAFDCNAALDRLAIDQTVQEAVMPGGAVAASQCLAAFMNRKLSRYGEERNQPDADVSSGLSPYLHFGHISVHDVFRAVVAAETWTPDCLADARAVRGSRAGWWGMSDAAESFLDELVTWRELGFNMCWQRRNYDRYESLPDWARQTLAQHAADPRPIVYSLDQLREAATHDAIWNAAQTQLVSEGRMHNYLRMLWGKKILEWSPSPQIALDVMIELNNRFAVDGRNPNSYSGIFWVLGRYDRPWGPERPIFGKIRYMSSDNTAKKLDLDKYLERYGSARAVKGKLF